MEQLHDLGGTGRFGAIMNWALATHTSNASAYYWVAESAQYGSGGWTQANYWDESSIQPATFSSKEEAERYLIALTLSDLGSRVQLTGFKIEIVTWPPNL